MNRSGKNCIAKGMYFISLSTKYVQEGDAVTDAIKVKDIDSKNYSGRPLNEALRGEEFLAQMRLNILSASGPDR
jgi:hypothetical protein